jgi:two-component system sensor kinase FixL
MTSYPSPLDVESERELRRLARIVELTTDLVAFTNVNGELTYLNEAARRGLDMHFPCAAPQTLAGLFTPEAYAAVRDRGLPSAAERGSWTGETSFWSPIKKREIPISLVILAHKSSPGKIEYYSFIARDMTASKRAAEQERQYLTEIAHAGRLITLGEMVSGLAHELNQPLAAISNYAQGLLRRVDGDPPTSPGVIRDGLQRISQQARRAGDIIRHLRRLVRKGEFQRGAVDINRLLDDMVRFCAAETRQLSLAMETYLDPSAPVVLGDRVQIEQVVLNLLRNAMDASSSPEGGPPTRITVCSRRREPGKVLVEVSDQGHGLPPGDSEKLFERFFTTKPQGIGLGLSISRSIVETHGGKLWARSNAGPGATFGFTLPENREKSP